MNILTIFIVTLVIYYRVTAVNSRGLCPEIKLSLCKKLPKINRRYTYYDYPQTLIINKLRCPNANVTSIKWQIANIATPLQIKYLTNYDDKRQLLFRALEYESGDYILKVKVSVMVGVLPLVLSQSCTIRYICEPPVIIFRFGTLHFISPGSRYDFDMSKTKYCGVVQPPMIYNIVNVKISCTKVDKARCRLVPCPIYFKGIRYKHNPCHSQIDFHVTITHHTMTVKETHTVIPKEKVTSSTDYPVGNVYCHKNCDHKDSRLTRPDTAVSLELQCEENCDIFQSITPDWEICAADGKILETSKWVVVSQFKILIKKDVLEYDTRYNVFVRVKGKLMCVYVIRTIYKVEQPKCTLKPVSGISLRTRFEIKCVYKGHFKNYPPRIQIIQWRDKKAIILKETAYDHQDVGVLALKNQRRQVLQVRGSDIYGNDFTVDLNPIDVDIATSLDPDNVLRQITNYKNEGDNTGAMEFMQGLLSEMKNHQVEKEVKVAVEKTLLNQMATLQAEYSAAHRQITHSLGILHDDDLTPELQKEVTNLCSNMATAQHDELEKSKYAKIQGHAVAFQAEAFKQCANLAIARKTTENAPAQSGDDDQMSSLAGSSSAQTSPVVATEETTTEISHSEPVVEMLKEDYPDYEDELSKFVVPKTKRVEKAAFRFINKVTKNMAMTLAAGEQAELSDPKYNYTVTIFDGNSGVNIFMGSGGVIKVLNNSERLGETLVAIANEKKTPGTSAALTLSTVPIDLLIYPHKNFTQIITAPADITFNATVNVTYQQHTVVTPNSSWALPNIDYNMNVHRFYAPDMKCTVFIKLENVNDSLQVVIIKNRRPRFQDFQETVYSVNGSKEMPQLISMDFLMENTLYYVGILPHNRMLKNSTTENITVTYNISVVSSQCLILDEEESKWIPSTCKSQLNYTSNATKLTCKCKHNSRIAGIAETVPNKLDVVTTINFVTVNSNNWIIFIYVASIFGCYCIALCFGLLRNSSQIQNNVYFLSDNLKNDKYAYLLVVKTGCYNNAGTTSNICIEIYGSKKSSLVIILFLVVINNIIVHFLELAAYFMKYILKTLINPHVLNYPDPAKKMLQRGTSTLFILTTDVHLGELHKIRLWYDCIGYRPDWYCEEVKIFDMQKKREWFFKVNAWLSVLSDSTELKVHGTEVCKTTDTLWMSIKKNTRINFNANNTWNIFARSDDHEFSYYQRITVLLSMIYTTFSMSMLIISTPTLTKSDAYGYGDFDILVELVGYTVGCSFIATLVNAPFSYIFRNSASGSSVSLIQVKKLFPRKHMKAVWICLYIWILICMAYLIIFSFGIPLYSSYIWILCTSGSLLISVLLMDSLILMIFNILHTRFQKPPKIYYNTIEILKEAERQRIILYKKFGEVLMRPYFVKHYCVLTEEQINIKKHYLITRFSVASLFRDMLYFIVFTVLLYIICLTHTDHLTYYSNYGVKLMIDHALLDHSHMPLHDINSVNGYYQYINETIIPITHLRNWYANWYTGYEGMLVDCNAKLLGVIQLRQQRRVTTCTTIEGFNRYTNCFKPSEVFDDWENYDGSKMINTLGQFNLYSGRGYIAELGRSLRNAYYSLRKLKEVDWIDASTEVLFIEFWTYNANHNVFNMIRIIIERDLSGRIVQSCKVFTTKLVFANRAMQIIFPILLTLLTITILLLTIKHIALAIKNKRNLFKNFWNIFDILLISLSIVLVCIYIHKDKRLAAMMIELISSNHNEFVMFFELLSLSQATITVSAILVCLATVRLWKYFRFGIVFRIIERTIWKSSRDLAYNFMLHGFVCMMFASLMHILYGTQFYCFRSFFHAIVSMLLMSLNLVREIDFDEYYDGVFKYIYICFLFVTMVFEGLYVCIIMENMCKSQEYYSEKKFPYNIKNYILDETSYLKELIQNRNKKARLKGGEDIVENDKVYPKSPSERYDDCLVMSEDKFLLMRLLAMGVLRNKYYLGEGREDKNKLMARVVVMLKPRRYGVKKTDQMFFSGCDPETGRMTFVPDYRLQQMEFATKFILSDRMVEPPGDECVVMHISRVERFERIQNAVETMEKIISRIKIVEK